MGNSLTCEADQSLLYQIRSAVYLETERLMKSLKNLIFGSGLACSTALSLASPAVLTADSNYSSAGFGNYPRVTELEQRLLGQSYLNEPLPSRLARLEIKQFGKQSSGDLCDRLDKFDRFLKPDAETVSQSDADIWGEGSPTPPASTVTSRGASSEGDSAPSNYPRVNELEQRILGATHLDEPVLDRVARLENQKFDKEYAEDTLCDRIDRLDRVMKLKGPAPAISSPKTARTTTGGGAFKRGLMGLMGGALGAGPGAFEDSNRQPGGSSKARKNDDSEQGTSAEKAPVVRNPFAAEAEPAVGTSARMSQLEKFVWGRSYEGQPSEERLQRLEKKLIPYLHNTASQGMEQRVNRLWSTLEAANSRAKRTAAAGDQTN